MSDDPNEIVAAARQAKEREQAAEKAQDKARNWPLGAIGVGIGSAAIAAAVIFANRSRSK